MALQVKHGYFDRITGVTTQTISGIGFRPKIILFSWALTAADGWYTTANYLAGFGLTYVALDPFFVNHAAAGSSTDAAGTSTTGRRRSNTKCVVILSDGAPTLLAEGGVSAATDDSFTIDWTTNAAPSHRIYYTAYGGSDITTWAIGSGAIDPGAVADVSFPILSFKPDVLIIGYAFTEGWNTNTDNLALGIGFATALADQGCLTVVSEDGRANMDTWKTQRTDRIIRTLLPTTGALDADWDFQHFDANGFTLHRYAGPAVSTPIFFVAMKGGRWKAGNFAKQAATGNQDVTTVGFQPEAVRLFSFRAAASTAVLSHNNIALGGSGAIGQRGVTVSVDEDAVGAAVVQMQQSSVAAIVLLPDTPTTGPEAVADLTVYLANGFQLNWSVNAAGSPASQILYLAAGSVYVPRPGVVVFQDPGMV